MISFLVVEDNKTLQDVHGMLITRKYGDVRIDCASNGKEALAMINTLDYTVILTDVVMPEMNGIELYMELKGKHPLLAKRVAFITANFREPYNSVIIEEKRPCITKPYNQSDFYGMIDAVLHPEATMLDPGGG